MKHIFWISLYYLLAFSIQLIGQESDVVGFWKAVDNKGHPQTIVAIYEYQGKYYGRMIANYDDQGKVDDTIYHPKGKSPVLKGNPYYAGMDFMWGLTKEGSKYKNGKILDPEKGKIYNAEMWRDKGNLIVRGEIWVFGENQTWPPAIDQDFPPGFEKPDLTKFVPVIPQIQLRPREARTKQTA